MNTRDRFPFDSQITASAYGVVNFNLFAATADQRTFWVTAGANDGERLLAHYDSEGKMFVASRLHAEVLVAAGAQQGQYEQLLRRCADRCPVTELLEVETTAPTIYARFGDSIMRQRKWLDIPGFGASKPIPDPAEYSREIGWDNQYLQVVGFPLLHSDGWFSRTTLALPIPAPIFAPDAKGWDIREGVYLSFPDGSCRLIPRKEYYEFTRFIKDCAHDSNAGPALFARQGDLLFFRGVWYPNWPQEPDVNFAALPISYRCIMQLADEGPLIKNTWAMELGRHQFVEDANLVRHPEHGEMTLPNGAWTAVLMPGTSRPFARRGGVD